MIFVNQRLNRMIAVVPELLGKTRFAGIPAGHCENGTTFFVHGDCGGTCRNPLSHLFYAHIFHYSVSLISNLLLCLRRFRLTNQNTSTNVEFHISPRKACRLKTTFNKGRMEDNFLRRQSVKDERTFVGSLDVNQFLMKR